MILAADSLSREELIERLDGLSSDAEKRSRWDEIEFECLTEETYRRGLIPNRKNCASPPSASSQSGRICFTVKRAEFLDAIKSFGPLKYSGTNPRLHYVDVQCHADEIRLISSGVELSLEGTVLEVGYGRVPLHLLGRIRSALSSLRGKTIPVSVCPGRIVVGSLSLSHPQITMQLMAGRIAELPLNASEQDVLEIAEKFLPEELEESGLAPRVLDVTFHHAERLSKLIDRAAKTLAALGISPHAVRSFVHGEIEKKRKKGMS